MEQPFLKEGERLDDSIKWLKIIQKLMVLLWYRCYFTLGLCKSET